MAWRPRTHSGGCGDIKATEIYCTQGTNTEIDGEEVDETAPDSNLVGDGAPGRSFPLPHMGAILHRVLIKLGNLNECFMYFSNVVKSFFFSPLLRVHKSEMDGQAVAVKQL